MVSRSCDQDDEIIGVKVWRRELRRTVTRWDKIRAIAGAARGVLMAKSKYLISLITKDNDYQREQGASAEVGARSLGVEVEVMYANSDAITQSQQLLDVLLSARRTEFKGIVMEPAGGTSMTQVARAAVRAGVGWALLNREVEKIDELRKLGNTPVFAVSSDHEEVGRIQGRQFKALLKRGGTVLYLQGPTTSAAAQSRTAGMNEARPHNVAVKMLRCATWTEDGGYNATISWLRLMVASKERIDIVAGQNDLLAMGARKALREAAASEVQESKWDKVRYTGIDGLQKTGQAWVQSRILAATVVVPSTTFPALRMLVQSEQQRVQPPANTKIAPYSFPEIEQLVSTEPQPH
jgi:ribose transport system substrate-binding protein